MAKVVDALSEYMLTGEITGAILSISTLELFVVVVTACVGAFPNKSVKVIVNETVPDGSEDKID